MTGPAARRELLTAVGCCLAGGGLVLVAAGRPWARVVLARVPPLPGREVTLSGRDVAGLAFALGVVAVAAALAVLATRGVARALVGVLVVLAGAGAIAASVPRAASPPSATAVGHDQRLAGLSGQPTVHAVPAWPTLSAAGGLLVLAGGALVTVRGRRWPGMGGRYDAPTPTARTADPAVGMWESLDRDEDPTQRGG